MVRIASGAESRAFPERARLTTPRDQSEHIIRVPDNGLAMSRKMAEMLHLKAGDTVTVLPVKGRRDPLQVPVVEIADSYIGVAVYADITFLSHLIGEDIATTGCQWRSIRRRPSARLYRELKRLPAIKAVNALRDVIKNMQFIVETQRIFIGFIVAFACVIFFSSLLNTSLIGLAERRREVATLLVLGYTPWQVGNLFLRESLVLTSVGTLVGLPLGYGLSYVMSVVYNTEMFRFPLISPPQRMDQHDFTFGCIRGAGSCGRATQRQPPGLARSRKPKSNVAVTVWW